MSFSFPLHVRYISSRPLRSTYSLWSHRVLFRDFLFYGIFVLWLCSPQTRSPSWESCLSCLWWQPHRCSHPIRWQPNSSTNIYLGQPNHLLAPAEAPLDPLRSTETLRKSPLPSETKKLSSPSSCRKVVHFWPLNERAAWARKPHPWVFHPASSQAPSSSSSSPPSLLSSCS